MNQTVFHGKSDLVFFAAQLGFPLWIKKGCKRWVWLPWKLTTRSARVQANGQIRTACITMLLSLAMYLGTRGKWGGCKNTHHGNSWRVWTLIFRGNEVWVRDLTKFHCVEFTFFCLRKNLLLAAKAANALVATKNQPGRPPRQYRN